MTLIQNYKGRKGRVSYMRKKKRERERLELNCERAESEEKKGGDRLTV